MKALVKRRSEVGLWLEDVPEPEVGLNDVLIRVDRTGICGTDLHIYKWDKWAQKNHSRADGGRARVRRRSCRSGRERGGFSSGGNRQRRRPRGLRALPKLPRGTPASLQGYPRRGGESPRCVCGVSFAADDQRLASSRHRGPRCGVDFRSLRQCRSYRTFVSRVGRGCADYGSGADRHYGGGGGSPRGSAARGDYGHQSLPLGTREKNGRDAGD